MEWKCGECGGTIQLRRGERKGGWFFNCDCGLSGRFRAGSPKWKEIEMKAPKP